MLGSQTTPSPVLNWGRHQRLIEADNLTCQTWRVTSRCRPHRPFMTWETPPGRLITIKEGLVWAAATARPTAGCGRTKLISQPHQPGDNETAANQLRVKV